SEMAFLETVANFRSKFWSHFHDLVDAVDDDSKLFIPRSLFDGRYAILVGLQGIDTQHEIHEELHPIYAMALRKNKDQFNGARDCWAILARNWGNEGGCASHQHFLDANLNRITFLLPPPKLTLPPTAVTEISRDFDTNSNATAVSGIGF